MLDIDKIQKIEQATMTGMARFKSRFVLGLSVDPRLGYVEFFPQEILELCQCWRKLHLAERTSG